VNELMTGSTGAAADEFVEIVNTGTTAADIGGFRLAYRSGAGTSDVTLATVPPGTTLTAGGFYLFGGSAYAGTRAPDQSFSAAIAATAGGRGAARFRRRDRRFGGLRRRGQRVRRGPSRLGSAGNRHAWEQRNPAPGRARHERQRRGFLRQREPHSRELEPLAKTAWGAAVTQSATRPLITLVGDSLIQQVAFTASAGLPRMA
jgi:hypothetical protein